MAEETPPPAPPAVAMQPSTGAKPPEVQPSEEPKTPESPVASDETAEATKWAAERGQLILERFSKQIENLEVSNELSTQVGIEPKFEVPKDFNLREQLTTARHFEIAEGENAVAAYVKTWEKGKPVGRLRVRDDNLKIQDRIEPDTEITIVVGVPAKRVTKQIRGKNREILYVKVQYKDTQGNMKEGYAALDYLVSPYDRGQQGKAGAEGGAKAEAPAAQASPSPQAQGPGDVQGDGKPAEGQIVQTQPNTPIESAGIGKGGPAEAGAEAPESIPAPERKEAPTTQSGDQVKILRYGEDGEFGTYLGSLGENVFVKVSRKGVVSTELFRYGEVVAPGKKIQKGSQETASDIENRNPLAKWIDYFVPKTARLTFIDYNTGREYRLNPGVKIRLSDAFQRANYQRYPTYRERLAYVGNTPGALLTSRDREEFVATSVPNLEESRNYDRFPKGNDLASILDGKIPRLEWKDDRFYRLDERIPGLKEHELLYVLNPDFQVLKWTAIRSNGEQIDIRRTAFSNDHEAPKSKFIKEYKKDRIVTLLRQMDFAGVRGYPELKTERVFKVTDDLLKLGTKEVSIKSGEFVREIERDQAGISTVEKGDGRRIQIESKNLKEEPNFFERVLSMEGFELGQIDYVIQRFQTIQNTLYPKNT